MLLEKLTNANGVPSLEHEIRNLIKEEIKDYVDEIKVDRMGNIIAFKNKDAKGKNIALNAHMDEAGLIVTSISDVGLIKFDFWGIEEKNLVSQQVEIGDKKIKGVIGAKPIHLQKIDERATIIPKSGLYIDIGATSKEDALKHVSIGDGVAFKNCYAELGENIIRAKAINNRVGCFALIEILKSDLPYKITACFSVQDEVATRGSKVLAKQINADVVINLDATASSDTLAEDKKDYETILGEGVAISLVDKTAIYFKKYNDEIIKIAKLHDIKYQLRESGHGITDAGNYFITNGGTPTIGLSVPCRYINTSVGMFDKRDLDCMINIVKIYIYRMNLEENFKEIKKYL